MVQLAFYKGYQRIYRHQVLGRGIGGIQRYMVFVGQNHENGRNAQRVELGEQELRVEIYQRQCFLKQLSYSFFHSILAIILFIFRVAKLTTNFDKMKEN